MNYRNILIASAAVLSLAACSKVPAGNVGVKVYLLGSDKGVDSEELGPGRYYIGMNEELYLFPTFSQNYTWEQTSEGAGEAISFQDKDGMIASADVGITYSIDGSKATEIFQKYRRGVNEITDIYLRNMVRDALVRRASTQRLDYIYGLGKAQLIDDVQADVSKQVSDIGIRIEKVYWIGAIRLPDVIVSRINKKNEVDQLTLQRDAEVRQTTAEAAVVRETAKGLADKLKLEKDAEAYGTLKIAEAEAQSIQLKAEAEAKGIKARAEAITDNLIKYELTKTWKGGVPNVVSGGNALEILDILKAGATQQ